MDDDKEFEEFLNQEDENCSGNDDCFMVNILKIKTRTTCDLLKAVRDIYHTADDSDRDLKRTSRDYLMSLMESSKSDLGILEEFVEQSLDLDDED